MAKRIVLHSAPTRLESSYIAQNAKRAKRGVPVWCVLVPFLILVACVLALVSHSNEKRKQREHEARMASFEALERDAERRAEIEAERLYRERREILRDREDALLKYGGTELQWQRLREDKRDLEDEKRHREIMKAIRDGK